MSTAVNGGIRNKHRHRHRQYPRTSSSSSSSRSSSSSSSSSSRGISGGGRPCGNLRTASKIRRRMKQNTSEVAKELVASFKTLKFSRRMTRRQSRTSLKPASPDAAATTAEEDDDDKAFTVLDCRSLVLGGDGKGDQPASVKSLHWQPLRISLEDAMNTVSSSSGDDSSSSRRCKRDGPSCRQSSRPRRQHHREHRQQSVQKVQRDTERHHRSALPKPGYPPPLVSHAAGDAPGVDVGASWKSQTPQLAVAAAAPRRRCYVGFERLDDQPVIETATPMAIFAPRSEQAKIGRHPPTVTGCLFRCAEFPRPELAVLKVAAAPRAISPLSTSVDATSMRSTSQLADFSGHCRSRRREFDTQRCHHRRACRCAPTDCHVRGQHLDRRRYRSRRRRSIHRLEAGDEESEICATADESIVDISASTVVEETLELAASSSTLRRNHLLEPPMPPSYRVWVPVGANSGPPPPRWLKTSTATAAALECGNRLTRTAARTARSVTRRLRHAICGKRDRETAAGQPDGTWPAGWVSRIAHPSDQHRQTLQQRQFIQHLTNASNANSNNEKVEKHKNVNDRDHYSNVLCTLDRAEGRHQRLRLKQHQQQQQQQQQQQRKQKERLNRREVFTKSLANVDLSVGYKRSDSTDSASSISDDDADDDWKSQLLKSQSPTTATGPTGCRSSTYRPAGKNLSRKIDLINTMANSLLGLSHSLNGCVGSINKCLVQMQVVQD